MKKIYCGEGCKVENFTEGKEYDVKDFDVGSCYYFVKNDYGVLHVLIKSLFVDKKILIRPTKTEYYLNIAKAVSARSTCLRRQYGAIIVKNDEIISTGYNGSPRGCVNCIDIGSCYRKENNIPSGQRYETCKAVHAEQNAIISTSREKMIDAELYLYGFDLELKEEITALPCLMCEAMIKNVSIGKLFNREGEFEF